MLLESLVVYACLQGKGCSDSTSAYYSYNKELQYMSKRVEHYGQMISKDRAYIVYVATPLYAVMTGKKAEFLIHKGFYLLVDVKEPGIGLKWSY